MRSLNASSHIFKKFRYCRNLHNNQLQGTIPEVISTLMKLALLFESVGFQAFQYLIFSKSDGKNAAACCYAAARLTCRIAL